MKSPILNNQYYQYLIVLPLQQELHHHYQSILYIQFNNYNHIPYKYGNSSSRVRCTPKTPAIHYDPRQKIPISFNLFIDATRTDD